MNISQGRTKEEEIAQSHSNAMDRIRICILFGSVLTSKHKQQKDTEDDTHWKKSLRSTDLDNWKVVPVVM